MRNSDDDGCEVLEEIFHAVVLVGCAFLLGLFVYTAAPMIMDML